MHCLRCNAGNSSKTREVFCEIVYITSMVSSRAILMFQSVLPVGDKKDFWKLDSISWVRSAEVTIVLFV